MKNVLKALYTKFVSGKQKAIVGTAVPLIVGLVAHVCYLDISTATKVAGYIVSGVLAGAGVYLKANK